ncbi:hypothetical protein HK096_004187, partial [Nowakowskiella sp. JEL0078]
MDFHAVVQVLTNTLSSDNAQRKAAEDALDQLGLQLGFAQALLELLRIQETDVRARSAGLS